MNSSVKSLVPMVTVGLPLPGCDDELLELLLLLLLLLPLSLLLLPHAAINAAVASSATAPPMRGLDTSPPPVVKPLPRPARSGERCCGSPGEASSPSASRRAAPAPRGRRRRRPAPLRRSWRR